MYFQKDHWSFLDEGKRLFSAIKGQENSTIKRKSEIEYNLSEQLTVYH